MQKRADVPDGWPFISYDPTTYEPLERARLPLAGRALATMREAATLVPAAFVGLLLIVVLAAGGTR